MAPIQWNNPLPVAPRAYDCAYCNRSVGPDRGYYGADQSNPNQPRTLTIFICSFCGKPSFFDMNGKQYPGAPFGRDVESLPPDVAALYGDARASMSAGAFTPAVLPCRKILMHLAVEKGAPAGQSFLEYVEYLAQKGYVPPNGYGWVDHIRTKGNEANHEIKVMGEAEAKDLITFTEMLLKFDYEFPAKVTPQATSASSAATKTP